MPRILLSVPHMGGTEQRYANEAFTSNWMSTAGPNLAAFEEAFSRRIGLPAVSLASGTAAIHLGLRLLGVGPGDEVFCSDPDVCGFHQSDPLSGGRTGFHRQRAETWNMDPACCARRFQQRAARNKLPRAIVVVHLYGQCADMDPILEAARGSGFRCWKTRRKRWARRTKGNRRERGRGGGIFVQWQ